MGTFRGIINNMVFIKGHKTNIGRMPWNKGKPLPPKARAKLIARNKAGIGSKNPMWKGDSVGNDALHDWVARHRGNPRTCEKCGFYSKSRYKIHWANKSHEYKRELEDWLALCVSCHALYDGNYKKRKRNSKGQFV